VFGIAKQNANRASASGIEYAYKRMEEINTLIGPYKPPTGWLIGEYPLRVIKYGILYILLDCVASPHNGGII
jgi:hypothetical protein